MKGTTSELLEILILSVGATLLILISYFLFTSGTQQPTTLATEQQQYDRITDSVSNFFYTRIPKIEKTFAQMLGDIASTKTTSVYYGEKYGGINVSQIVYEYFDAQFDSQWHLFFTVKDKNFDFGYEIPTNRRTRTFIMKLPIPSFIGEVIDVKFTQW